MKNLLDEHLGFDGVVDGQFCKAVLLRLGGEFESVIDLCYPPPPDYREAIRRPFSLTQAQEPARYAALECRTFVRDLRLRSSAHKWWFRYNNGGTETSFDAYVYREVGSVTVTEDAKRDKDGHDRKQHGNSRGDRPSMGSHCWSHPSVSQ